MTHVAGYDLIALAPNAPDFTQNTYAQMVSDTLGDTATDTDALAISESALAALMAAYEQDVSDGLNAEDVPDEPGIPFDVAATDAMIAALAVADAEEQAITGIQDFLEASIDVWNVLPFVVALLDGETQAVWNSLLSAIQDIIARGGILGIDIGPFCDPFEDPDICGE